MNEWIVNSFYNVISMKVVFNQNGKRTPKSCHETDTGTNILSHAKRIKWIERPNVQVTSETVDMSLWFVKNVLRSSSDVSLEKLVFPIGESMKIIVWGFIFIAHTQINGSNVPTSDKPFKVQVVIKSMTHVIKLSWHMGSISCYFRFCGWQLNFLCR